MLTTTNMLMAKRASIMIYDAFVQSLELLGAGRFGVRIPVGARFSIPFQTDTEAHPVP
jgi:ribonuclease HIII